MNLRAWSRSVDFRLGSSLQGFCVLYFILSEFLTKDALECIVNPTYLIGCCDCTLINLALKIIVLIFNTTYKMGCCEYWYWLGWYNLWRVKSKSLRYYITRLFFLERYAPTTTFVLLFIYFFVLFYFVSYTLSLTFILRDFCVPIKHGFLKVFPF